MTNQIGKARGTTPVADTSKPAPAPSSNVSPGLLKPGPNTTWIPVQVSAKAIEKRAENPNPITIGASDARIAKGERSNQTQTVATPPVIAQESAIANSDSEFSGDVVVSAQEGNEKALKAETHHDDEVAKRHNEELKDLTDARLHDELPVLPVGIAVG